MKSRTFSLLALSLSTVVFAANAVVDLATLLESSKSYTDAKTKLEAQVKREQGNLEKMAKEIEAMSAKLEKNGPAMKAEDREKAQKELMEKQNGYATKQMNVQRDLYKANQDALTAAFEQIRAATAKVAERQKLDLVLPKAETVYASLDITKEVKEALSEK